MILWTQVERVSRRAEVAGGGRMEIIIERRHPRLGLDRDPKETASRLCGAERSNGLRTPSMRRPMCPTQRLTRVSQRLFHWLDHAAWQGGQHHSVRLDL